MGMAVSRRFKVRTVYDVKMKDGGGPRVFLELDGVQTEGDRIRGAGKLSVCFVQEDLDGLGVGGPGECQKLKGREFVVEVRPA